MHLAETRGVPQARPVGDPAAEPLEAQVLPVLCSSEKGAGEAETQADRDWSAGR